MNRDDGDTCLHCGRTGYAIHPEFQKSEILRDAATGRTLLPWEIRAIPVNEMQRRVAAGKITVEPRTIEHQVADPTGYCRYCGAGRDREHQELANTPVLKRVRKRRVGERDAS
ncbi:MAG: hypothetical protein ACYC5Y_05105 [Symbiobacteriia bacterium]